MQSILQRIALEGFNNSNQPAQGVTNQALLLVNRIPVPDTIEGEA